MLAATATAGVGASLASPAHAASGNSPAIAVPSTPAPAHPHLALGGNGSGNITVENGTFFSTDSYFSPTNTTDAPCGAETFHYNFSTIQYYYDDQYCYSGPQTPSIVDINGSTVGTGYSLLTDLTPTSHCLPANATNYTATSTIIWQTSSNGGQSWGNPEYLQNASNCQFVNEIEPSFAISGTGTIYGAWVEENYTQYVNVSGYNVTPFPFGYSNRTGDALGFTYSTSNGTNFTNISVLSTPRNNIANPQVAAFGATVYILYENISNGTMSLPSNTYSPNNTHPISENLIWSDDNGLSWNGPYVVPGLNASSDNTTEGAAIAVNSQGEIAISYVTNRSCEMFTGFCYDYGGEVVVVTSTTNGSTWSPISEVSNWAGELTCGFEYISGNFYYCERDLYQWGPKTSVAWSPLNPSTLYVAWTGSYYTWNVSGGGGEGGGGGALNIGYGSALFSAMSSNTGGSWTRGTIDEPTSSYGYDEDQIIQPSLAVSATTGEVYVSYTDLNETYCYSGCNPVFSYYASYWIGESANGVQWSTYPAAVSQADSFYTIDTWVGQNSAITVTPSGPVAMYSEAQDELFNYGYAYNFSTSPPSYYYWDNFTYYTSMVSAFTAPSAPLVVNFTESGLVANSSWGFSLSGNLFSANTTTIQIDNIPFASSVYFEAGAEPSSHGGWSELVPVATIGQQAFFFSDSTVWVNYTLYYGWAASVNPVTPQAPNNSGFYEVYFDLYLNTIYGYFYLDYYSYDDFGNWYNDTYYSSPLPWYVPDNTSLDFSTGLNSNVPVSYVFGSGNGSYTGVPTLAIATIDGPVNESFFLGALGVYNVTFQTSGLPSGTPYSFDFAGTTYSATSPATVTVPNVFTGAYALTNISATSATAGWEYFGSFANGEVEIPESPVVTLNFTTYIDVGAPTGIVHLHAVGLATGDFWQAEFNGTTYGSSTPWINLTEHPGTYLVSALPVATSLNDTTAYSPTGFGPSLSVTAGSTYDVDYSLSYRVQVASSVGGTVTGLGSHWATPGTALSFHATPDANYNYLGWTGTGAQSYSGMSAYANVTVAGPITESANFQPLPADRFNLTVSETGLPAGTSWTADLNGTGYSTSLPTEVIPNLYPCTAGAEAQYGFAVPYVYVNGTSGLRYVATGVPATTCTNGATVITLAFHPEYLVTPFVSGPGSISENGVQTDNSVWVDSGSSITLTANPNSNALFDGWLGSGAGNYTGPSLTANVIPTGPVTELATFTTITPPPTPLYTLGFQETSPLAPGTTWSVTVNGTVYTPHTAFLNVTGLTSTTYPISVATVYSPDHSAKYTPKSPPTSWDLTANHTIPLAYSTSYLLTVSSGAGGSTTPTPGSGYYPAGSVVELVATPSVGHQFVGWAGSGPGSYTGTSAVYNVTVSGAFTEVAAFAVTPTTSSSSGSWITSTTGIAVLAVLGLAVGVGAGYVLFGRKSGGGGTSGGAA